MTYIDKYHKLRAYFINELKEQLLIKKYDKTEQWEEDNEKFNLPTHYYLEDFGYEIYSIVLWDGDSFKGIGWESNDEYWFGIDDLDTNVIAHILDILNESDKV